MRAIHSLCLCLILLLGSAVAAAADVAPEASRPVSLTVLTYNVQHHTDTVVDDLKTLVRGTPLPSARIAPTLDLLARQEADVIALQEVTPVFLAAIERQAGAQGYQVASTLPPPAHGWRRDVATAARYLLGYQPWGQAIVSKWPLSDIRHYPLGRPLLVADVVIGDLTLTVATCHLDSFPENRQTRLWQLQQIFAHLGAARHALLLGDFNFGDEAPEQEALTRTFTDIWPQLRPADPGYTYPADAPHAAATTAPAERARLDRILLRSDRLEPVRVEQLGQAPVRLGDRLLSLSDHYGVVADLRY